MKKLKSLFPLMGLVFCAAVLAKTWYVIGHVSGTPAADQDAEYSTAAAAFRVEYSGAGMINKISKGDLVDIQYEDGSIMEFTLFNAWKTSSVTWDPTKTPKSKQGPFPANKSPTSLYQPNGNPISVPLYLYASPATPTYTLTITQFDGGCNGCTSTTTAPVPGGGAAGGGGGGGGTGPVGTAPTCDPDNDPSCAPTDDPTDE